MPTYMVFHREGLFSKEQEERVARAITRAHAQATGAPEYYVQVIMHAGAGSRRFVGGVPCEDQVWIRGDIRAGRTKEQLAVLLRELVRQTAEAGEISQDDVWVDLNEIRPEAIIKYQTIFSEAGKEAQWEKTLPAHLKEKWHIE